MRLKKLIVHGFKSFADHVEIAFEGGITGVVGPNGCGKSNIADAVRWVLGEQSARTLRGSKMEDVIFNGTEKRRRLAFCEVTLVFDNEDRALPIDFAEVAVTRRVYRSGEGEYKINGAASRLKDIVDLFRDTGIGKDGYSLIGQGRIDEILSQRSEDRRQVFEEAAGIVKFKARKLEAQRRMEHTRDNLSRVEDILSELEARVEPLRLQSEAAREYLSLRDELKVLDLNVFLARSKKCAERLEDLKATGASLLEACNDAQARLDDMSARRETVQETLEARERAGALLREEVQALIRDVEAREGALSVLTERITNASREKARITSEREAALQGREGIRARLEQMNTFVEGETQEIRAQEERQRVLDAQVEAGEAQLQALEARSEALKQAIIDAMNQLGDVRSNQGRVSAMQAAVREQLSKMATDQAGDTAGAQSLREQENEARAELDAQRRGQSKVQSEIDAISNELTSLNDETSAQNAQLHAWNVEYEQLSSRLKLLREMQRDYEGYANSVKQVLLWARRQPDSGVCGVVADLVKVPGRLERAMDMVLGASLQHIVVERDEDAKRMIEYLRKNRMGRATFLPIGSIRGRTLSPDERRLLAMPGCVGLASELVSFDPRYRGIVENLLGRTIVAEDLTRGIAIQRAGRYQVRLVTLEGDVMHAGGSMTGGSVQSRATSLLSRGREIEEAEARLRTLEAEVQALTGQLDRQEEKRRALKAQRTECFDEKHRQDVVLARAEIRLSGILEEQKAHAMQLERAQQERRRLETQLQELTERLGRLETQQQRADENTDQMQKQARDLSGEIFEKRSQVERMRAEAAEARVRLASSRRGLEARVAERDRFRHQAEDTEEMLARSAEALAACEAQLETSGRELSEDSEALVALRAELDARRAAFDAVESERTGAQRNLQALTSQIDGERTSQAGLQDRLHRAEVQTARVEGEFKQLQDRIWEDYELTEAGAEPFRRDDFKLTESEKRISAIRQRIRQMGTVNVAAVDEYRSTCARVEALSGQRDDLNKAQADLQDIVEELEKRMESQFKEKFALMNQNFSGTFVKLFGGGRAELRLSDPSDALNCGIEIVAQPPGKKLQMLSLLSGGERALTAIAILFAILDLKPTPFCILDEIEAALDDANIDTYAEYLKAYSTGTQFIVITHRKGTMERCDALYGVVMEEKGVSKTVSVKLSEVT